MTLAAVVDIPSTTRNCCKVRAKIIRAIENCAPDPSLVQRRHRIMCERESVFSIVCGRLYVTDAARGICKDFDHAFGQLTR